MGLLGAIIAWLSSRGTPVPLGAHRAALAGSVPDYTEPDLVFKLPLLDDAGGRTGLYVLRTNAQTRFSVNGDEVSVDTFLEAYDEAEGVMELEVCEIGTAATMNIRRAE